MPPSRQPPLPTEVDVLVAGSGASGLTAALTAASAGLSVSVIESADKWGGTSALGGGRVWIPPAAGTRDTPSSAIQYLAEVFGSDHEEMARAFVESARPMMRFIEARSRHRFVVCPNYPDYHPHLPGWSAGGRAHDAAPVSLDELCPEASDVLLPPSYLPITHEEWEDWRFPRQFDSEVIEDRRRSRTLTNGASLVASLLDGSISAGANLVKGVALVDASPAEDGSIVANVKRDGETATIRAAALILATGGFDADPELRSSHLPEGVSASASAPTNTGVALRVALAAGLAVENLGEGWWMPMVMVPGEEIFGQPYPRALVRERGVPHQIVVNRGGERFVNEASPYHEFVKAMNLGEAEGLPNREAWIVFDEQFRAKYSLPGLTPAGAVPSQIDADRSIAGLAHRVGIDPSALRSTIDRWNESCRTGIDPDFARGDNPYDRYYGDSRSDHPNLGTIAEPPFYATRVFGGTVGSKGGPVTTPDGLLIDQNGMSWQGWYAVGNAAAFWTGAGYPGPGATLGIGMTFAYRAAMDAIRFIRS